MPSRPITISVDDQVCADMERVRQLLGAKSRSDMFRHLIYHILEENDTETTPHTTQGIEDSELAAMARSMMAGMAGVTPAEGGYPAMDVTAYEAALVVARRHMEDIQSGILPMVEKDVHAVGLDPYGKHAWDMYMEILPTFYGVLLGCSKPDVDIRYTPLPMIDGQCAGAIQGEIISCDQTYPDDDTTLYTQLQVDAGPQQVRVLAPAKLGTDLAPGMTVYAAGMFRISDKKVTVRANKCVMVRLEGYDTIYELANTWSLSNAASSGIIHMLRECHGEAAPEFAPTFVAYMGMDKTSNNRTLVMPGGGRLVIERSLARSGPPGLDGMRECMAMWQGVLYRARSAGALSQMLYKPDTVSGDLLRV